MMALIMSFPIVSAQSLSIQQFSGDQGIRNVAKSFDTLTVKALVEIPGDPEITPNQVRFVTGGGIMYLFDACSGDGSSAVCTFKYPIEGQLGKTDYGVWLFNDDGVNVNGEVEILVSDMVDPEMSSFSVDPVVSGGSLKFSYEAHDYAVSPGDVSSCAGVGELQIFEESTLKATIPVGKDCVSKGTLDYSAEKTGTYNLCAVAVDRTGRTSAPLCTEITVDKIGPAVTGSRIISKDGFDILAIPPTGTLSDIQIIVSEDSIDPNSVRGDFGKLADNGLYNDRAPVSISSDNPQTLTWTDVPINKVSPCEFSIRAADTFGNTLSKTLSCSITSDVSPPVFQSFSTGFAQADGKSLLGTQGVISVRFTESAMARANAYLDVSGFSGSTMKADKCVQEGADWVCSWKIDAGRPSGEYSVSLLPTTADDLGNLLGNQYPFTFVYDAELPTVGEPVFTPQHIGQDYGQKVVNGDVLTFTFEVTDVAVAMANFEGIGGNADVRGDCTADEEEKTHCSFTDAVGKSGSFETKILFSFQDAAGNTVDKEYPIEGFGLLDEANPNYWTSKVTCSPSTIDRTVAPLIATDVYCKIKLVSSNDKVEVANVVMGPTDECTGDLDGSVSSLELINNGFGSDEPYLHATLAVREYPERKLSLTCPVMVFTKVGDGFTQNPEMEPVTVSVQFGESKMSSLSTAIDSKVQNAVDSAEKMSKYLSTFKKIDDIAQKVCMIRGVIWDVVGALEIVIGVLGVAATALSGDPLTEAAANAVKSIHGSLCSGVKEPLQSVLGGELGGAVAGIDANVLKPMCDLANCQLTDFGNLNGNSGEKDASGKATQSDAQKQSASTTETINNIANIKESLVLSVATLCVPGIIYNLDKYRQIQCRYAVCLKRDVSESGVPISVCDDEKAYLTCLFVWTQAFALVPYSKILGQYVNMAKDILSNPFALLATLTGLACKNQCQGAASTGLLYTFCSLAGVVNVLGTVIGDVQAVIKPETWSLGQGSCDELDDLT